jgi:hypothetical protein
MFDYYLDIITFSSPFFFFLSLSFPKAINPLDRISIISRRKKKKILLSLLQTDKDGARKEKTSLTRVILYKMGGGY